MEDKYLTGKHVPNKFYICVPKNIEHAALAFIQDVNPSYGLIVFDTRCKVINARSINITKHPKKIHEYYDSSVRDLLIMRLCSEVANFYLKKANSTYAYKQAKTNTLSGGKTKYRRTPEGLIPGGTSEGNNEGVS